MRWPSRRLARRIRIQLLEFRRDPVETDSQDNRGSLLGIDDFGRVEQQLDVKLLAGEAKIGIALQEAHGSVEGDVGNRDRVDVALLLGFDVAFLHQGEKVLFVGNGNEDHQAGLGEVAVFQPGVEIGVQAEGLLGIDSLEGALVEFLKEVSVDLLVGIRREEVLDGRFDQIDKFVDRFRLQGDGWACTVFRVVGSGSSHGAGRGEQSGSAYEISKRIFIGYSSCEKTGANRQNGSMAARPSTLVMIVVRGRDAIIGALRAESVLTRMNAATNMERVSGYFSAHTGGGE